jgi:threonine/homoserine/homoserine lactone efflux protein
MLPQFIATTWLLAMLPGMGQALMLRQTLADGPRVAVATICGTATGLVIWSAAAGAGLSAALLANETVYRALLLAGGGILIVIGARTIWSAGRPADASVTDAVEPAPGVSAGARGRTAYLAGLATNLGNPKAGVFAVSLLPAFAGVRFLPTVGFGLVWAVVTACWYLLFVMLVAGGRTFMTCTGAQRVVSGVSGLVLIAVGIGVAAGV